LREAGEETGQMEDEEENSSISRSSEDEEEEEEEEEADETKKQARSRKRSEMREEQQQQGEGEEKNKTKKKKNRRRLLEEQAKVGGKRGICYLSRIPPHLKPLKLRHLLSQFGEVLRIYLAPEDAAARRMRRKRVKGGNSGKNFTEGWVEFAHKSVAKKVAEMLNGESMEANRRRSAYHYDLWNIKYLRKFKWENLTEEIAYKNAVREQRLAAEISAAKKERDFYLSRVDQSRAINSMEERKRKRKKQEEEEAAQEEEAQADGDSSALGTREGGPISAAGKKNNNKPLRFFPQKKTVVDGGGAHATPRLGLDVLSKVFGQKGE
jgi:ESF2/ABP1 family protein